MTVTPHSKPTDAARAAKARGVTIEAWHSRVSRQVATMIRQYGYRDKPGQRPASRPDAPIVIYRGATLETWRGPYWSPRRETAEGYALIAMRAGWDARVFTTTVPPESVIHQVNPVELFIHPDTLTESMVDMYIPAAIIDPEETR